MHAEGTKILKLNIPTDLPKCEIWRYTHLVRFKYALKFASKRERDRESRVTWEDLCLFLCMCATMCTSERGRKEVIRILTFLTCLGNKSCKGLKRENV